MFTLRLTLPKLQNILQEQYSSNKPNSEEIAVVNYLHDIAKRHEMTLTQLQVEWKEYVFGDIDSESSWVYSVRTDNKQFEILLSLIL